MSSASSLIAHLPVHSLVYSLVYSLAGAPGLPPAGGGGQRPDRSAAKKNRMGARAAPTPVHPLPGGASGRLVLIAASPATAPTAGSARGHRPSSAPRPVAWAAAARRAASSAHTATAHPFPVPSARNWRSRNLPCRPSSRL